MAKQFVVARGQIEKGKEVLAKQGDPYKPRNAADEKRLLDAGVIAEVGAKQKAAKAPDPGKTSNTSEGEGGEGDKGEGGGAGTSSEGGDGAGGAEGGQGNA